MTNIPPAGHSAALHQFLIELIQQNQGKISFAQFMQQALYHPQWGYYQCLQAIGEAGDFITAPESGRLFAQCIATQIAEIAETIHPFSIVEFGPGSGQFAKDCLQQFNTQSIQPEHYYCVEISEALKKQQQQKCQAYAQCQWVSSTQLPLFSGVVILNEVFDALPVNRYLYDNDTLFEMMVAYDGNSFYEQAEVVAESPWQAQLIKRLKQQHVTEPYRFDLQTDSLSLLSDIAHALHQGIILIIDYGYTHSHFFHPERHQGTLKCFYQHQAHEDPFQHLGKQDMTAHINFSLLAEQAINLGLSVQGFTQQSAFLMNTGLLSFAEPLLIDAEQSSRLKIQQEIQRLTHPAEMGERIKVLALSKNFDQLLMGFDEFDRSHLL